MRRALLIFALVLCSAAWNRCASGQAQSYSTISPDSSIAGSGETVDGIVARIEDDVLTESELRELASFQELVDGHAKLRADLIQELSDQWIVRGEAAATRYPAPTSQDVDRAYAQLVKQFASTEEFARRRASANLTDSEVREMLKQQLYLARFLDYRFGLRPRSTISRSRPTTNRNFLRNWSLEKRKSLRSPMWPKRSARFSCSAKLMRAPPNGSTTLASN